jgi:ABC-type transport system involved in Fe-S cluster assembly fused permease/ATPase subunit
VIIVLQRGKIVERGTHEQLMGLQAAYAKLVAQE